MKNPYSPGKPVTGDNFFGRLNVINELVELITNNPKENSSTIVGRRRIGKTSILLELQRILEIRDYPVVYIQVVDVSSDTFGVLLHRIEKGVLTALGIDDKLFEEDLYEDFNINRFKKKLDRYFKKIPKGSRLVFLFDEIDKFIEVETYGRKVNLTKIFRDLLREWILNYSNIFIILALGKYPNDQLWLENIKSGQINRISTLNEDEVWDFLNGFPNAIEFTEASIKRIIKLTGGHPCFIQAFGRLIFDDLEKQNKDSNLYPLKGQISDVKKVIPLIKDRYYPISDYIWNGLSASERILSSFFAEKIVDKDLEFVEVNKLQLEQLRNSRIQIITSPFFKSQGLEFWELIEKTDSKNNTYRIKIPIFFDWVRTYYEFDEVQSNLVDLVDEVATQHFELSKSLLKDQPINYSMVEDNLNKAINRNPNHLQARLLRSEILLDQSKYDMAIEDYLVAIKLAPHDNEIKQKAANAYVIKGNRTKDVNDYLHANSLDPNNLKAISEIIRIYEIQCDSLIKRGNWQESINVIEEIIELLNTSNAIVSEDERFEFKFNIDYIPKLREKIKLINLAINAENFIDRKEYLLAIQRYVDILVRDNNFGNIVQRLGKVVRLFENSLKPKDFSKSTQKSKSSTLSDKISMPFWKSNNVDGFFYKTSVTLKPEDTLGQALGLMIKNRIDQILIQFNHNDKNKKMYGLITLEEIFSKISKRGEELNSKIGEPRILLDLLMKDKFRVLDQKDPVLKALSYLSTEWLYPYDKSRVLYLRSLPIKNRQNEFIGFLRYLDILKAMYYGDLETPDIEVKSIMTKKEDITIIDYDQDLTAQEAYWIFTNPSSYQDTIPIINDKNKVANLINIDDLMRNLQEHASKLDRKIEFISNPDYVEVHDIKDQHKLKNVLKYFLEPPYHKSIPVTHSGRIIGLLSYLDIFKAIIRIL